MTSVSCPYVETTVTRPMSSEVSWISSMWTRYIAENLFGNMPVHNDLMWFRSINQYDTAALVLVISCNRAAIGPVMLARKAGMVAPGRSSECAEYRGSPSGLL